MASNLISTWRQSLDSKGMWPKSALARFTAYIVALDVIFQVLTRIAGPKSGITKALSGWLTTLTFIAAVLLVIVTVRWTKKQLLWRLRNRLIVTYIFIGVIPVVLILLIGSIAGYLFAGQFATFVATEAIEDEVQALEHTCADIAIDLGNELENRGKFSTAELKTLPGIKHLGMRFDNADLIASDGKQTIVLHSQNPAQAEQLFIPPWVKGDFSGLVADNGKLFLRSTKQIRARNGMITLLASAPLEGRLLNDIATSAGEITLIPLEWTDTGSHKSGKSEGESADKPGLNVQVRGRQNASRSIRAGTVPPPQGWWDKEIQYFVPLDSTLWKIGPERSHREITAAATGIVSTRVSALYARLFASFGKSANLVIFALVTITVIFGVIELFALIIGVGLTRTVTDSVANLY
ncbi:MAG TPA: hypothetical protein VF493_04605, partial [Terriglobales bacterium]